MYALIDYWIPDNARADIEHFRQARLAVIISYIGITSALFYVPMQYFALMYPVGALVSAVGTVQMFVGLLLLKSGVSYRMIGHNIAFTYCWALAVIALGTGGIESSAMLQYTCIPLVAMILCGKRAGVIWLGVCLVETFVFSVLRLNGVVFPISYPSAYHSMLYITGQPGAIATIFFLALAFERSMTSAQEQSESILLNIFPVSIAEQIKDNYITNDEVIIIAEHSAVTVMFVRVLGLRQEPKEGVRQQPEDFVRSLDKVFSAFDDIAVAYQLEKIKTIGECYMLAGGVPRFDERHCDNAVRAALQMQAEAQRLGAVLNCRLDVRIGIHTGAVVAGVLGKKKFTYDLWGDTVNTASRMETHGEAGKIHCTRAVYEQLCHIYAFEERGEIEIKGKGAMQTYFLGKK